MQIAFVFIFSLFISCVASQAYTSFLQQNGTTKLLGSSFAGTKLVDMCSTWKHAQRETLERAIALEACWHRFRTQVDSIRSVIMAMHVLWYCRCIEIRRKIQIDCGLEAPRIHTSETEGS